LICIKTRNPIIFAFHPKAQESSKAAAIVMRDAAVAAGAPEIAFNGLKILRLKRRCPYESSGHRDDS
jgi:acetaldehyde dehydrogenase/alcohol dehydrogenase